jgi:6-phosphogluconolactonase
MKNLKFTLLSALVLIASTASLRAEFLYVANVGSYNISAYQIGKNGSLTPVLGSPFPAGNRPTSVAVDPLGRFAYVTDFGSDSNNISAYQIGKNGSLTPIPGSPFPAANLPTSVTISPQFQKE